MGKVALITGCAGQDGFYLAQLLKRKGYVVHGLDHRRPDADVIFHDIDLNDSERIRALIREIRPDEVYNLAAQSSVQRSFDIPVETGETTALGAARLMEAIRRECPDARFFQPGSSEMFGNAPAPQSEATPLDPRSPYAIAKSYAYWLVRAYRDAFGAFACNGIMYNHESPRRPEEYLTRKITRAVAAIKAGKQDTLYLGNLDAKRDWGYAPEYVDAMWRMLQHDTPDDYVIATGETHTVREFCDEAFKHAGTPLRWEGEGTEELGVDPQGVVRVRINPAFFRPVELHETRGDAGKAKRVLGWTPKVTFKELVRVLVDAELRGNT